MVDNKNSPMPQDVNSVATSLDSSKATSKPAMSVSDINQTATEDNDVAKSQSSSNGVETSTEDPKTDAIRSIESPQSDKKRALPDEDVHEQDPASKKPKDVSVPSTPKKDDPPVSPRFPSPPEERATEHDKEKWEGWCEIESDPDYVSAMMRMMGVQGVSVRQAFTIDVDYLKTLPQPIYGLIFLFRYRECDSEKQEKTCPANVWFANQLPAQNSCATLALFNILMNADGVELGDHLQQFKEFTNEMTPYLRGEAFASFRYVKRIHNSFAKKMDMLEDDKHLAYKAQHKKTSGSRKRSSSSSSQDSIEESAHHFIAFLPIDGHVWKLDGMDCQPTKIGPYAAADPDAWLQVASTRIMTLMAAAGDQDYSVLSVVQSPVVALRSDLCTSFATVKHIESRLDGMNPDWRSFLFSDGADPLPEPVTPTWLGSLGVSQEQLASAEVPSDEKEEIDASGMEDLLERRAELVKEQASLQDGIMAEMDVEATEDAKAKARQWDYGPVIQKWLEMLAENGHLEENLERFIAE
jgi:ubiquitin carboxyl-terminal hydrolase L5